MLFTWSEQSIRWFLDASAYTGFHKTLAQELIAYLEKSCTLCDVGCGLGRLDLELAPHIKEITAVDSSEDAISVLRHDAAASGVRNLHVRHGDASELKGSFDVILMSFFGQSDMPYYLGLCRRRLIRIVSAENKSGLYPERHRRNIKDTVPIVRGELIAQGLRFKLEHHEIEFGQPLRSWQDAERYVLKNAPEAEKDEVSGFLNENLVCTNREDFPFYLPNKKALGVFIIDKEA